LLLCEKDAFYEFLFSRIRPTRAAGERGPILAPLRSRLGFADYLRRIDEAVKLPNEQQKLDGSEALMRYYSGMRVAYQKKDNRKGKTRS